MAFSLWLLLLVSNRPKSIALQETAMLRPAALVPRFLSAASCPAQAQSAGDWPINRSPSTWVSRPAPASMSWPHAAALAREDARPAPGDRLQGAAPAATSLPKSWPAPSPTATLSSSARPRRTASTPRSTRALVRRRADFTPISTLADVSSAGDQSQVIDARDVKDFIAKVKAAPGSTARLDRQRHGAPISPSPPSTHRPASTWCTCRTRAGRRPPTC